MAVYSAGSWVWLPDEDDMFVPAKVVEGFKGGESGKVDREGYVVKVGPKESSRLERMDDQSLKMIENMVELKELNEAAILHNLRLRFAKNEIYTNVGTILVSVNPFKLLPLYTADVLEKYKTQGYRNLPPHVYGVADDAYKSMIANQQDQSCIVSGESGAGKTEATKIFLQYIAEVSGASLSKESVVSFERASLQEQILKANPLMEAFGNAKTVRNNNSSRFGKWISVEFNNKKGDVIGGQILQYLLEKSRVVAQAEGERNYHIFYNLCAGASMDKSFKEKFRIGDPEDYHYLNQSGTIEVDGISDENDFETVLNSMETVGIGVDEQDDAIRTIAAIMHLGNVEFVKGQGAYAEDSRVSNPEMLELAAAQFGVTPEDLEKALCFKMIRTGRDVVAKPNTPEMATDSRDVFAKEIYQKLFEWLIKRINRSLAKKTKSMESVAKEDKSIIGVLDIFGFESFEYNSFEQLCINYCNEKLQFHFNEHIFKLEQNEYKAEGIDVSHIDFADNQPTLDLFEVKRTGLFAMLDEEMNIPRGSDTGFLTKITKQHSKHPSFKPPGVKTNYERQSFSVVHYAGEVMYNVTAFLEKNRDKLSIDIVELVDSSKIKFVKKLVSDKKGGSTQGKGKDSLGSKFQGQLATLMKQLNATNPHFIRCVKPNDDKSGDVFTSTMVLDQLRYAGLLEVCRIRQIGYPVRKTFKEFLRRYAPLAPSAKDAKSLCKALAEKGLLTKGEYALGKKKVFMRNAPYNDLEASREVALRQQAVMVQKVARGFVARCAYRRYMVTIDALRKGIRKRDYELLKKSLDDAGDLPNQGGNLDVVAEAWDLLQTLEEERRIIKLLVNAMEKRDLNALRSAVAAAEEIKFSPPDLAEAKKMIKTIEEEKKVIENLKSAVDSRDLGELTSALKKAGKLKLLDSKEAKQATVLKERLEEENRVVDLIEKALAKRDLDKLKSGLAQATDMGIENAVVDEGQKMLDKLLADVGGEEQSKVKEEEDRMKKEREEKIKEVKAELIEAAKEKDLERLAELKSRILELGVKGSEIDALLKQANALEDEADVVDELVANVNTLRTIAESQKGITLGEIKPLTRAIRNATKKGVTEEVPELREAVDLEQQLMEQVVVQKELQGAIASGKLEDLKRALDHAGDLDMDIDLVTKVKKMIKDLDASIPKSERKERKPQEVSEEEFERQRNDNMAMAQHERYNFRKYYKIRTDGDFTKGLYFNKRKVAESKLSYQKNVIPKSILELEKDLNKMALNVHKSILGYCGEQLMSFPATLAQDILIKGLEQPDLVDEVYVQLMKHLTNNPKPESVGRAWQLMCMAVGTFPPSSDFEYYLLNFLLEHVNVGGLVGNYARYSLRRLDGMLIRGASGFVPNIDEILSYKERPPILATIELVDGTPLTEDLPITPDLNCEKVLEICTHFLSLKDERHKLFGIFVQDVEDEDEDDLEASAYSSYSAARTPDAGEPGPPSDEPPPPPLPMMRQSPLPPRTPRPLRSKDYLGDVVVQMTRQKIKHTFVFKRKLFVSGNDGPSKDQVYSRLMYLQAADEVISGNIPVTKEPDVVLLTAMAIAADLEQFPATEEELLDENVIAYVPVPWRTKKTDRNWAKTILAARGKVAKKSLDDLQSKYVDTVRKFPLYGHCFFYVRETAEGADMILSVSHEGITFLSASRVVIKQYSYTQLARWGGSSQNVWLLLFEGKTSKKEKQTYFTSQARDISSLILDYAVLAADRK
ncbi:High molecular weight form of myosin-1 (High molecular weight form of myosin I) (HMWMI) [Durusdinium trenchii]|uniref:High molecular weight form of myosin-1 (High molecular weight form of myosin I) (HMWMI) n=1 Tax=Durusdinium trenchii TaxID=1381693 RepID=A0ABP0IKE7_9DINO